MLSRVLYTDDRYALEMNWLGLGALQVRERGIGVRRAHSVQKRYFLAAMLEMERVGQPISPSNPAVSYLCRTMAGFIMEGPPSSLTWRLLLDRDPRLLAQTCIYQSQ